jgi:hypothetical protein
MFQDAICVCVSNRRRGLLPPCVVARLQDIAEKGPGDKLDVVGAKVTDTGHVSVGQGMLVTVRKWLIG